MNIVYLIGYACMIIGCIITLIHPENHSTLNIRADQILIIVLLLTQSINIIITKK